MSSSRAADVLDKVLSLERSGRFQEARELLLSEVASSAGLEQLDMQLRLGRLCLALGGSYVEEAERHLTSARAAAESLQSAHHVAMAVQWLAQAERRQGRPNRAAALLDESPCSRDSSPAGAAAAHFFQTCGLLESDAGSHTDAERFLIRAYQLYDEAGDLAGCSEVCETLAGLLLGWGKAVSAQKFCERSLELKRRLGDHYGALWAAATLGRILLRRAQPEAAAATFQHCLQAAEDLQQTRFVPALLCHLGETALARREFDAAVRCFRESLAVASELPNQVRGQYGLARAWLMLNRIDEAEQAAAGMQAGLERIASLPGMPAALDGVRGAIAWRRGDLATGERLLQRCIDIQCDQGRPIEAVFFLYELRDLRQSAGDLERAVSAMSAALRLLGEAGAERVQDDLERWLQTVDQPWLTRLAVEGRIPARVIGRSAAEQAEALKPGRREVAVLFCDVRGYTSVCEGLAPDAAVELLNEWFSEAARAIERHGGIVDKYVGDAVLAVFGLPEPREDAAADAVRAALDMREALNALNLRQSILHGREIRVAMGVDLGEAVVGLIGSPLHHEFSAIGDPVNTASRLEEATKNFPGCDILTSQAVDEVQQKFEVAETMFLGNLVLKGKAEKVPCYQVHGPKSALSTGDTVELGEAAT